MTEATFVLDEAAATKSAALACLVIHSPGAAGAVCGRLVRLRRRLGSIMPGVWRAPRPSLTIEVSDSTGRQVFAVAPAAPLTKIQLPPGTYDVFACHSRSRRRYTMTFQPGAVFDLHIRLAPDA